MVGYASEVVGVGVLCRELLGYLFFGVAVLLQETKDGLTEVDAFEGYVMYSFLQKVEE